MAQDSPAASSAALDLPSKETAPSQLSGISRDVDLDDKESAVPAAADKDIEKGDLTPPPAPATTPAEAPAPFKFDPSQFPDGGLEAWLVVLGGFCALFCSFGWINAIGVFQNYYQTHQLANMSPSTISWIPSLESFMMFLGGPIIGKLYDNYGPRWILIVGTFLHVFGLMMTSLASKYYQFILAQGICSPIGASMIFYPAMSCCTTWFFKNRALAIGVMAAGSSIGGVIFPIMVDHLISKVGFGWTMRIAAFVILGLMIVANLTIKSRIPPHPKPLNMQEFLNPYKELPFIFLTAGCFLFFIGMFLPINYLIVYARAQGMSTYLAGYLIPILNGLSLFGRILPGWAGDRIGRYNVLIVLCLATAIFDLAIWIPSRANAPIIVFAALYGFGSGAFVSMAPALIAQITPDIRQIGVRTGSMFAVISIAALIGNPIGGALVDKWHGSFTGLQIFCGVLQLAGGVALIMSRTAIVGVKVNAKV